MFVENGVYSLKLQGGIIIGISRIFGVGKIIGEGIWVVLYGNVVCIAV